VLLGAFYFIKRKKIDDILKTYLFIFFSFLLSLFMMTQYSSFIWDRMSYLWYIQFPWRFLTFVDLFIAIIAAFTIYFLKDFLKTFNKKIYHLMVSLFVITAVAVTIFKYYSYFKPQKFISTNDQQRTSFKEIAWRISGTSYEFVPNSVKTKKTSLGTTTLAIKENDLTEEVAIIKKGQAKISVIKNKFSVKEFEVLAKSNVTFQLNTYNFPGWEAKLDGKKVKISDNNDLQLINVQFPQGNHELTFEFKNTLVRTVANLITIFSVIKILTFFLYNLLKKYKA
jgi:hypothetical protein